MCTDMVIDEKVERRSLDKDSWEEACAERWYRSQEAGCDQGEHAIRQWVQKHWRGFLRARWIEHMQGYRFWVELPRAEFGLLQRRAQVDPRPLLDEIIDRVRCGAENLDLICWAFTKPPAERCTILEIVRLININAHRLQCSFGND